MCERWTTILIGGYKSSLSSWIHSHKNTTYARICAQKARLHLILEQQQQQLNSTYSLLALEKRIQLNCFLFLCAQIENLQILIVCLVEATVDSSNNIELLLILLQRQLQHLLYSVGIETAKVKNGRKKNELSSKNNSNETNYEAEKDEEEEATA